MYFRQNTRKVNIGGLVIGGGEKIAIQSMCNTKTADIKATVAQINALDKVGCDIIRCAVPDIEAARAFREIKNAINIPIVADIHFDYRLAIEAMKNGADKIRINPGNIGSIDRVSAVVKEAKARNIPIRIGINSGSLEKDILLKYGGVTSDALAESAIRNVKIIESMDYDNLVVSIKASNTLMCVNAYEIFAKSYDYPLHLGITEAGSVYAGSIKSAVGLGIMMNKGIGDTIRVSLTSNPLDEIKAAALILQSLGLKNDEIEIVSCPTCGRTNIDLIGLAARVEEIAKGYKLGIKLAVMGCVVNGPGEAAEADLAIAGGKGEGLIIKKGKIIKKVREESLLYELKIELDKIANEKGKQSNENDS